MGASNTYTERRRDTMEQSEVRDPSPTHVVEGMEAPAMAPSSGSLARATLSPQVGTETCGSCGSPAGANPYSAGAMGFGYALGRVEPRFPSLSVEKELAQATGRAETNGLTDRQALHSVLSERRNRYLVRKLCWVLTIEGLETYILHPHDPADWDLLVEALRPTPRPGDYAT